MIQVRNKTLNYYSSIPSENIIKEIKSSTKGLSQEEAEKRLKKFGKNILVEDKKTFWLREFLSQFKNPLILILLAAATISITLGEIINAIIIYFILVLSTLLNFYQERKANHAAQKLKNRLNTKVAVIRNGKEQEIEIQNVCVGDILSLAAGDLIPADARIISSKDFFVNQSALTGESFPVKKGANSIKNAFKSKTVDLNDLNNMLLSGTNAITGTATAIVVKTGFNTEFGKISKEISVEEEPTSFTVGIGKFSSLIMKATIFIVLMVFLINALMKHDLFESFLFAVAVAVGLTPELLPMILSVTMSNGSVKMAKKGAIVKKLVAIPNFGSMDVLCTDKTGTLTEDKIVLVKYVDAKGKESESVLLNAYLTSHFQTGIKNPMDEAVLKFEKIVVSKYKKIDEVPFDFMRKRMSVVLEEAGKRVMICKGAPEDILAVCDKHKDKKGAIAFYEKLSAEGYRVLAVASKELHDGKSKSYESKDENDLDFLGFVAFLDPPKKDVKEIFTAIEKSGISIKIITGDNELVTKRICEDLDIEVKGILLGHKIAGMTDDALRVAVEKNNIFARFSPDEKNRIINALRKNRHIVGYMGDGINDAPSLDSADVGISVENAVDVAKESADIVLTNKNLKELLDGILEGRKTFGNSMKYIMMGVSSNFGNMFSVIGAVLFLPYLPMLPMQILLNNLLYDFSQITIPNDNVDDEYTSSPKRWNMVFVKKFMMVFGWMSSFYDFATFFLLYAVFHANAATFQTGWFIESLATQTLIIHIIRTRKMPFVKSIASKGLLITTFLMVGVGWIIPFTPIGKIFGFEPLPWQILLSIAGLVLMYLITVEIGKRIFYRHIKSRDPRGYSHHLIH